MTEPSERRNSIDSLEYSFQSALAPNSAGLPGDTKFETIAKLKHFNLLAQGNQELIQKVAELFVEFTLEKDEFLYHKDECRKWVWIIKSGSLSVQQDNLQLNTITQFPAAIAFSNLFTKQNPATTSLRALEKVVGYRALKEEFEEFISCNPELNRALLHFLSAEVRKYRHPHVDVSNPLKPKKDLVQMVVFDAKSYDITHFNQYAEKYANLGVEIVFLESRITPETVSLARNAKIVCVFVNDSVNAFVVDKLSRYGVEMIACRSVGFNNIDLEACKVHSISVTRVPAYSPFAVAEHAIALIMSLNRKICIASSKTKTGDFSLSSFLTGFDMHGKTVGVIGTGKIGKILVGILLGFQCKVLCFDIYPDPELMTRQGVKYVDSLDELYPFCDIISLHSPLLPTTKYMINSTSISKMKKGVMIINTSRGALIDTQALIDGLKSEQVGYAGLDVYEQEAGVFFQNLSDRVQQDDLLSRLLSFQNVIVTSHQAFLTSEALNGIAETTFENVEQFVRGGLRMGDLKNAVVGS